MNMPTLGQVERATPRQLAAWLHFLPSPPYEQQYIMRRIIERWNTELSSSERATAFRLGRG